MRSFLVVLVMASVGLYVWKYQQMSSGPQYQREEVLPVSPRQEVSPVVGDLNESAIPKTESKSSVQWQVAEFDACGKNEKYQDMAWWHNFSQKIEKQSYYNEHQTKVRLSVTKSDSYDLHCSDPQNTNYAFCVDRYRKLSIDDFTEGCLTKDGKGFVAAFAGEYGGGGSYLFRYDVEGDLLEEAGGRMDDTLFAPSVFGRRVGYTIKMTDFTGDAGCNIQAEFDYNFLTNIVKLVKQCTRCDQEQQTCQSF